MGCFASRLERPKLGSSQEVPEAELVEVTPEAEVVEGTPEAEVVEGAHNRFVQQPEFWPLNLARNSIIVVTTTTVEYRTVRPSSVGSFVDSNESLSGSEGQYTSAEDVSSAGPHMSLGLTASSFRLWRLKMLRVRYQHPHQPPLFLPR